MRAYFFGAHQALRGEGHQVWSPNGDKVDYAILTEHVIPWRALDGGLLLEDVPPHRYPAQDEQVQGACKLRHREGWSAVAFWDRSVDRRFGSNSVFLFEAVELSFERAMQLAEEFFPWVTRRLGFQLRLA